MSELVDFLNRMLDEDEAVARRAIADGDPGAWAALLDGPHVSVLGQFGRDYPVPMPPQPLAGDWYAVTEWDDDWAYDGTGAPYAEHIARHDPARVLVEVEAKRAIVALYEFERNRRDAYRSPRSREVEDEDAAQDRRTQEARCRVAEDMVRLLALPYADRPGFDETWRP